MNLHFPDEVATNVLTIDATDPKSGTAEFKATAIRLEAGLAWISACSPPSRPTPSARRSTPSSAPRAANGNRVARADRTRRHLLLPALRAAQRRVGWVSEGALGYASRRLDVPPADAYGVASFYALLALEERPADVLHVCTDLACRLAGRRGAGGRARRRRASACASARPRRCARSPARSRASCSCPTTGAAAAAGGRARAAAPAPHRRGRRSRSRSTPTARTAATRRCGARSSSARQACCARSTSRACSAAAAPRSRPARSGRPSRSQPAQPHYLVCNADESEPGTFKDRVLMEERPVRARRGDDDRRVATGCEHGFVYVRAEYPLAHARLENAFAQARARLLGDDCSARFASTSSCASAPARTSAARRPRSSSRSRATAASRATSRRSRSRSGSSASRRS